MQGSNLLRPLAWVAIQQLETFTLSDLIGRVNSFDLGTFQANSFRAYLNFLMRYGYLNIEKRGVTNKYRLILTTGPEAPIPKRGVGIFDPNKESSMGTKVWSAMRVLQHFTTADLEAITGFPARTIYRKYLYALDKCGYLVARGVESRYRVYQLAQNTGPIPPIWSRHMDLLYDLNRMLICSTSKA